MNTLEKQLDDLPEEYLEGTGKDLFSARIVILNFLEGNKL